MEDLLIKTLRLLGYPIYRQGSLAEDDIYPESFFTFWNNSNDGASFYDNEERSCIWNFDLNFYSIDSASVKTKLIEAKRLLKAQGFIVVGKGYDVASDEPTHIGRGINVRKIQTGEG